jgi:hypothetical protein
VQTTGAKAQTKMGTKTNKQANKVKIYQLMLSEFKNMLKITVITIIYFFKNNN